MATTGRERLALSLTLWLDTWQATIPKYVSCAILES